MTFAALSARLLVGRALLSPIGDGVLGVYERDGASLDDNEGRIALVSLKDTRPGPRHVKWLRSIELRALTE